MRDQFVHRWFPLHITIVLGGGEGSPLHHLEIEGERKALSDFLDESRAFVIDRLVAGGLVMLRYATR